MPRQLRHDDPTQESTVRMFGQRVDLPEILTHCPRCRPGFLVWNDRSAWLCSGEECGHGVSVNAIFDEPTLEFEIQLGKKFDFGALPLSGLGAILVAVGILRASWTDQRVAVRRLRILKPKDRVAMRHALGVAA